MAEAVQPTVGGMRQNRGFILGALSIGHGISHLYDQGFPVFLPAIASSMGLGHLQVATMLGIRQGGFGGVNLLGGVVVDRFKRKWGQILTACMIWAALSFLVLAWSPNLAILVFAVIMISIPGALWHLPATAALSRRFPDRRGFAISVHGFGSNIGNVLGPILAGAMLTVLIWNQVLLIYAIPAAVMMFFVWWSLKDLGDEGGDEGQVTRQMGSQVRDGLRLFKNPMVVSLVAAAAIRGVATNALFQWSPFYLERTTDGGLGMGYFAVGVHMALLTGMGIISAPVLGYLSDRYGRKEVLVPGLTLAALLAFLVVSAGDGIWLAVVFTGSGLVSLSLQQIILASVLDVVEEGTEATASGLIFGFNGVLGFATPFFVTVLISHLGGYPSIYYYVGILTAISALVVVLIPFPKRSAPEAAPA